jgi:hypothetical protein
MPTKGKTAIIWKNGAVSAVFGHFLRNNRCSVTFGKISHGLYSGFGFHLKSSRKNRIAYSDL